MTMNQAQKKQDFNRSANHAKKLGQQLARELAKADADRLADRAVHIDVQKCLDLIAAGADVTTGATHKTPLMSAVIHDSIELVAALLTAGAPANAVDENGTTALYHALLNNRYDVGLLLVNSGADPCIQDVLGNSALSLSKDWAGKMKYLMQVAAECKAKGRKPRKFDIDGKVRGRYLSELLRQHTFDGSDTWKVKSLLNKNTDFSQKDYLQMTPLANAVAWGHNDLALDILCLAPHTVNTVLRYGRTPLFWCTELNTTKALLAAGADPTVRDKKGRTALDRRRDLDPEVFNLLQQAMADWQEAFHQNIRTQGISSGRPVKKMPRIEIRKPHK
jgi:ankyrin repeat protein